MSLLYLKGSINYNNCSWKYFLNYRTKCSHCGLKAHTRHTCPFIDFSELSLQISVGNIVAQWPSLLSISQFDALVQSGDYDLNLPDWISNLETGEHLLNFFSITNIEFLRKKEKSIQQKGKKKHVS